jgi:phosphoribosylformimino-5-aminoimidazole carboxamide ribotide isomerase
MVEIIPVLDIRGGVAVSGRSGNRETYRPLQTVFSEGSDPIEIAENLPFSRLYVADLDGIVDQKPDLSVLKTLSEIKSVMTDLGVRESEDLQVFRELKCDIILGTETIKWVNVIIDALKQFGRRVIVSIDIKDGFILSSFLPKNPYDAYHGLTDLGVKRIILLDISAVGTGKSDFSFIKDLNKTGEILLGGGITQKDISAMEKLDVEGVLVGTALHNGELEVK